MVAGWWVGGVGVGWVGGGNPPLFHAFLESYCSLENPLKKGSPALALAHYFNILTFSDAFFCSSQLASSSVVPRGLLSMRFGVIVRHFHARVTFWPILDNLNTY